MTSSLVHDARDFEVRREVPADGIGEPRLGGVADAVDLRANLCEAARVLDHLRRVGGGEEDDAHAGYGSGNEGPRSRTPVGLGLPSRTRTSGLGLGRRTSDSDVGRRTRTRTSDSNSDSDVGLGRRTRTSADSDSDVGLGLGLGTSDSDSDSDSDVGLGRRTSDVDPDPPRHSSCHLPLGRRNASRGREEALVKKRYTESFKARMVQRLVLPGGPAVKVLSKEVGVAPSSLWEWRKRFGTVGSMASDEAAKDLHARRPEDWSVKERLRAVAEAESLSDEELGVFLRREGLHEETLRRVEGGERPRSRWSEDARLRTASCGQARIQVLEKELGRKERALAAANAVVALQKKVHALWGDEDDDTSSGTDK